MTLKRNRQNSEDLYRCASKFKNGYHTITNLTEE